MTLRRHRLAASPAARIVLLKGVDESGFVFYSNYESAKGRDLSANPRACLCVLGRARRQLRNHRRSSQDHERRIGQVFPLAAVRKPDRRGDIGSKQTVSDRGCGSRTVTLNRAKRSTGPSVRVQSWGGVPRQPDTIEFWQGPHEPPARPVAYSRQPTARGRVTAEP